MTAHAPGWRTHPSTQIPRNSGQPRGGAGNAAEEEACEAVAEADSFADEEGYYKSEASYYQSAAVAELAQASIDAEQSDYQHEGAYVQSLKTQAAANTCNNIICGFTNSVGDWTLHHPITALAAGSCAATVILCATLAPAAVAANKVSGGAGTQALSWADQHPVEVAAGAGLGAACAIQPELCPAILAGAAWGAGGSALGYVAGCGTGQECSPSGFADTTLIGAEAGGITGGIMGGAGALAGDLEDEDSAILSGLPRFAQDVVSSYGPTAMRTLGGALGGGFTDMATVLDGRHLSPDNAVWQIAAGGILAGAAPGEGLRPA